jgi:hypothetical protein
MKRPALPLTRRFHLRPRELRRRLRPWERQLFLALFDPQPERRLWAHILADALCVIYRSAQWPEVAEALAWLCDVNHDAPATFAQCAAIVDLDAETIRTDVQHDVRTGAIRAKRHRRPHPTTPPPPTAAAAGSVRC